jgi:hypothetical protein
MKAEIILITLPVIVCILLLLPGIGGFNIRGRKTRGTSPFILLLVFLFSASAIAQTDHSLLRIRAHDLPEKPVWVGQQVNFYVTVFMSARPKGSPTFQVPEVPGGILQHIPARPLYGMHEIDGIEFTTWMYSFALYPHRAGTHTIAPIRAKVSLPAANGEWQQVSASTDPFNIASRMPAGAKGLSTLITSTEFKAQERWDPIQTKIMVGAAITRTITMRAADFSGMGFPPISFKAVKGVSVYPKPPEVRDETQRGDISGARIETVTYIFEQEGQYTLPGLSIPWFDIDTNELKRVSFPARRLEVAPNPAFIKSDQETPSTDSLLHWRAILTGVAVLVLSVAAILIFFQRLRKPLRKWTQKNRLNKETSEPFLFRELLIAARANDTRAVFNRSTHWSHSSSAFDNARTLTAFAIRSGDKRFRSSVTTLMQTFFGRDAVVKTPNMWRDPTFIMGLKTARNKCLRRKKLEHVHLPPINPNRNSERIHRSLLRG